MVDLFQDFMDWFCPYEWLGVFVVVTEVVLDDLEELVHAFEDPSANLFAGSKVYACPSDTTGAQQKFPMIPYQFQMNKRANGYMFRSNSGNTPLSPLHTTSVRSPSSILMITEKEWDSPNFQSDSNDLNAWRVGWTGGSKNYGNSGFEFHKAFPALLAADTHVARFKTPAPGATAPPYYPGLGDTRSDTSTLWTSPSPNYYMRDVNTAAGF
jgi:hypothetical protein